MRDDGILPLDRDRGIGDAGTPAGPATPQADGSSTDQRGDSPAALPAVPHLADAEEPGLSDDEIAVYRRRVADGMYNTPEVAAEVARRMMRRGDV